MTPETKPKADNLTPEMEKQIKQSSKFLAFVDMRESTKQAIQSRLLFAMRAARREAQLELIQEMKCKNCNGSGCYPDHSDHHDPETEECFECPIQVQCDACRATGYNQEFSITTKEESLKEEV